MLDGYANALLATPSALEHQMVYVPKLPTQGSL